MAPGVGTFDAAEDDGSFSLLLFEIGAADGSWAACDYEPGRAEFEVTQYGDRRLWDEVEAALAWWLGQDRPVARRSGLTVTQEGQSLWLDDASRLISLGR